MPMSTSSPLFFAHSWSLVYRRSAFTSSLAVSPSSSLLFAPSPEPRLGRGSLVERSLDDLGLDEAAAAVDDEIGAHRAHGRGHVAETDVLAQGRRGAAAGDHAHARARGVEDGVAVARDAAAHHLEADHLAGGAFLLDALQRGAADEVALVELDHPAEAGLDGVGGLVDVVAIER